jgi:hypothetical protein
MFDFAPGAAKAPKVFLDPSTGEVTGEEGGSAGGEEGHGGDGDGGHGHGGDGGHGPGGDGGHGGWGGGPGGGHHGHESVHCKVYGHGRRLDLHCQVSGGHGLGAVRFRVKRGNRVLGTSRAALKRNKATSSLTTKGALSGRYTLLATVSRTDGIDALSESVVLPGKDSVDLH